MNARTRNRPAAREAPPPTPEQLAERAAWEAEWEAGKTAAEAMCRPRPRLYTHSYRVYDLYRQTFDIPAFQRGYVWTPEQAIAMVRRLFLGMPLGQIMVWEQGWGKPPMLMDGQQRLVTLGAQAFRDGVPVVGHTVYVDSTKRAIDEVLTCDPGPGRYTLQQLDKVWMIPGFRQMSGETAAFITTLSEHVTNADVAVTVIGEWGRKQCTYEQAAQIFRCYNSGGTPIDPDLLPPEPE